MPEFDDVRKGLAAARQLRATSRRDRFVTSERLARINRKRTDLSRRPSASADAELDTLAQQEGAVSQTLAQRTAVESARLAELLDWSRQFEAFTDPRRNLSQLSDQHPILLFPLRLETRFKRIEADGEARNELWVRVYPDDILVDSFEEVLAEVEITNARLYWIRRFRAGGDEGELRAAWASLVTSHGAGRAFYVLEQYRPLNPDDEPVRSPGEAVLVVASEVPLPEAEKAPVRTYWSRVFLGDAAEQVRAFDDLVAALGAARADVITRDYVPVDFATYRPEGEVTSAQVVFLELPPEDQIDAQHHPWMRAATASRLPERFVVLGYRGEEPPLFHLGRPVPEELIVSPDPTADAAEQLRIVDDELVVPDEMKWLTDFDEAVDKGMGFRIPLTAVQARGGFDRLFVVGVRLGADAETGASELESLIRDHQRSRSGLSLLRQGAPTNNVEDGGSGYSWVEDGDASYDHYFGTPPDDPTDWRRKRDGRWLADSLGIDPEVLRPSPNYHGTDQCEARAMNEALWPATLGYFLDNMMEPVIEDDRAITFVRDYFTRYVLGRGTIAALRIGEQPYGILPATPFSRIQWIARRDQAVAAATHDFRVPNYLSDLYALIRKADAQWTALTAQVSYVGKPGVDPHQALLDVVGLHPSSVEYYQRYAETMEQLYNRFKLSGPTAGFIGAIVALDYVQQGRALLESLGHEFKEDGPSPEILHKLFFQKPNLLFGSVVDDVPLSETAPVRAYREDGDNYLQWLIKAAETSHDTLRKQEGFIDDRPPSALLYLWLQHALDLGYTGTALELFTEAQIITREQARVARREPNFFHVQSAQVESAQAESGSPWSYLYRSAPAITDQSTMLVGEFIPQILQLRNPFLNTQIRALEHLATAPTARLERAFAEHIDCCTYRLDAWWLGLLNVQLELMRAPVNVDTDGDGDVDQSRARRGVYLGAYGWVENLRPEGRRRAPAEIDGALSDIFNKPGQSPLETDSSNLGFIHAPSLDHAVTAAVLRNGYVANANEEVRDALTVNLTSERVRLAMGVIDGMRAGQSLSALLGYQLERGLHDREGLFLDSILYELRRKFPLRANRLASTRTDPSTPIEAVEARNVVDGLALVVHVQAQPEADKTYPFGFTDLPGLTDPQRDAVDAEVDRIANIQDAVADLAMAEGVYQVVRGNYERAAGTLEAYAKGNFPPVPEVVQTPRSGVTLTHRVGLHLRAGLSPDDPPFTTPRAKGAPPIENWLATKLPPMADVICQVDVTDPTTDTITTTDVSAQDLGLAAIDLLYLINQDGRQQLSGLDDHLLRHTAPTLPRPDAPVAIRYRVQVPSKVSFFKLTPLLTDLHALLLRSRPLKPTDVRLPVEAEVAEAAVPTMPTVPITRVRDLLDAQRADLATLVGDINLALDDPDPQVADANAVAQVDTFSDRYVEIADAIGRFGLPGAGHGFIWDWRRRSFGDLATQLAELIDRWNQRLAAFDLAITDYGTLDPATPDPDRITYLLKAARHITTAVLPPPVSGDPNDLLNDLTGVHRPAFVGELANLANVLPAATTVTALFKAFQARLTAIAAHDPEPVSLDAAFERITTFASTLRDTATGLLDDVVARIAAAEATLAAPPDGGDERNDALTEAMRKLTSSDFVTLPEFALRADHAAEWQAAYADRAQLLSWIETTGGVDFPVDEWLYGVARVREKLHHLERATMLTEALVPTAELSLVPLQFPYRANDSWLALQYPEIAPGTSEPFAIDEDKLLYTAHYATAFSGGAQCGVLVDEWTETIPSLQETTGLTFHFDQPSNEPPQTLLLALPADFTGEWAWEDLVDTLHETLDMARKRAVEPQLVDQTAYAKFVPALISSVTRYPIFHMLNLAFNNNVQFRGNPEDS